MPLPSLSSALPPGPARCELVLTAPFAVLGGSLWGWAVAPSLGLPPLLGAAACALALVAFVAVQVALEPWAVERFGGPRQRWGVIVSYLWDGVTGTGVGLPLAFALGASAVPGVGLALTVGAVYSWLMGSVVCGDGAELAVTLLFQGGGVRRRPDHSRAQALEARAEWDAAHRAYRDAIREDGRDPIPYFAIARILARQGSHASAVEALRDALHRAELTPEQEVHALQRIVQIREEQGRRAAAAPDLARYLERSPNGRGAPWARRELDEIKRRLAER